MKYKTLDQQAERLSIAYQARRASHKACEKLWRELRAIRARALKVSNRQAKPTDELPLFARAEQAMQIEQRAP